MDAGSPVGRQLDKRALGRELLRKPLRGWRCRAPALDALGVVPVRRGRLDPVAGHRAASGVVVTASCSACFVRLDLGEEWAGVINAKDPRGRSHVKFNIFPFSFFDP